MFTRQAMEFRLAACAAKGPNTTHPHPSREGRAFPHPRRPRAERGEINREDQFLTLPAEFGIAMSMHVNLPTAYLCAIECLDNGARTKSRLMGLIDHFERARGLQGNPELSASLEEWRAAAVRSAARRYFDFEDKA